jgi:Fe-S cluster assembly iron-binding protein IscA
VVLTLTTQAAQAIQGLVADHPGAGLRISSRSTDGNQVQLGLELSGRPAPTDEVIEEQGSHVFLDEQVAPLLDGRTLDARVTDEQEVAFTLLP